MQHSTPLKTACRGVRNVFFAALLFGGADLLAQQPNVTVQAAGRGKPYLNLQDGRETQVEYVGDQRLREALRSGQARARALASADLDGNGTPDVVAGYANNGTGILTVQRGNTDAFAPTDDSVFVRMQAGYNPDSLIPTAETYTLPIVFKARKSHVCPSSNFKEL